MGGGSPIDFFPSAFQGVTENMIRSAERWGCFLGFFRVDQLKWSDLSDRIDAAPANVEDAQAVRDAVACVICASGFIWFCCACQNRACTGIYRSAQFFF